MLKSERLADKAKAGAILAAAQKSGQLLIESVKEEKKSAAAPKLYDLTTLQREANTAFGFTAQETLDLAQSLYEKKLLTYPRTDSRYLTEDMEATLPNLVKTVCSVYPFLGGGAVNTGQVISDKDVTDHHAIIPTGEVSVKRVSLNNNEESLLLFVARRLVTAVGDKHLYNQTTVTAKEETTGSAFSARGKAVTAPGWQKTEAAWRESVKKNLNDEEKADEDAQPLPKMQAGERHKISKAEMIEGKTTPPKAHTENTLLLAMETAGTDEVKLLEDAEKKGLGTPATRAAIIEKLLAADYVKRSKKQLLPTEKGVNLIKLLGDSDLVSAKMTAEWENDLTRMTRGEVKAQDFMAAITKFVADSCETVKKNPLPQGAAFARTGGGEVIGKCPRCGADVVETKRTFKCAGGGCGFVMWKENKWWEAKGKKFTKSIAQGLLKKGRVAVKGFKSEKTGKTDDAEVVLDDTGGKYVNFRLEFTDKKK
jgi:DNA topoisomerase-3